jgi:hypothetical protein
MSEFNAATQTYTGNTSTEVTFSGGQMVTTEKASNEFQAHTGFEAPGDLMSTAKSATGSPVVGRGVEMTDTIQAHGYRMTLAMAIELGFVSKDLGGNFVPTAEGKAGATHADAPLSESALASGGTAEEAAESTFTATPEGEAALSEIMAVTSMDTQINALNSILRNDGEIEPAALNRLASQAGVEPSEMAAVIERAHDGMQEAVLKHLAPFGVYDHAAFTAFVHGSPETHQRLLASVRDLMMSNSTKGLESLARDFAECADTVDPEGVGAALGAAGIPFTVRPNGAFVLDLKSKGMGQVAFREAVRAGIIRLGQG